MVCGYGKKDVREHSGIDNIDDICGIENHIKLVETPTEQVYDRRLGDRQPSRCLILQEVPCFYENIVLATRPISLSKRLFLLLRSWNLRTLLTGKTFKYLKLISRWETKLSRYSSCKKKCRDWSKSWLDGSRRHRFRNEKGEKLFKTRKSEKRKY